MDEKLAKWQDELTKWVTQEEELRTQLTKLTIPWWQKGLEWITKLTTTVPRMVYPWIKGEPLPTIVAEPFVEKQRLELTVRWQKSVKEANRASFFTTLYQTAPMGIAKGEIANFNDYLSYFGNKLENISDEDLITAKDVIDQMLAKGAPAGEAPDWLEVSPEEEAAVREFLTEPLETRPRFRGIHVTTVEEMVKWLKKEIATPELPKGMTVEEVLAASTKMGLTEEQLAVAADYTDLMSVVGQAWEEQQEMIDKVLAGEAEYEMPKLTGWEKAKFIAMQPLQTLADFIKPYLEYVNYPMSGMAMQVAKELGPMIPGKRAKMFHEEVFRGYDELYEEARTTNNWYMAYSKAWEDWDVNWGAKLAIEIIVDPLTYLGFGIFTKVTKPLGRLGRAVASFERGFNYAADVPFNWIKTKWANIPKATTQVIKAEDSRYIACMDAAVGGYTARFKGGAKSAQFWTTDDIMDTIKFSIDHYKAHPDLAFEGTTDLFAEFGRYMLDVPPLRRGEIMRWVKQLDGDLLYGELTARTVDDINTILYDVLGKRYGVEEGAVRLFTILKAPQTPESLKKAIVLLGKQTNQFAQRIQRLARIEKPGELLKALGAQQHGIIAAQARSEFANSRLMSGIVGSMMNHIAQKESSIWRNVLDRYLVHPMAEAYLGFSGYPLWNAFEDMFRSVLDGVLPKQMSLEHFQLVTTEIYVRDASLLTGGASDIMGMLGTMPGREGAVSFLPGKVPEAIVAKVPLLGKNIAGAEITEWLGRHWIELSNIWGNGFRRNFVARKYMQYLAGRMKDIAGKDMNKEFNRVIGRAPETRAAKPDALRNEMFARVQTGNRNTVLDMKNMVNNTTLIREEQIKILHAATELTPQTRTVGEQMIASGEAIREPNAFCQLLADQITADLKAHPVGVVHNFEFMADHIAADTITTPDQLMQAFQHLVIMEDTTGYIPHRMMSLTHARADELMGQGKFGRVLDQLWRNDRTEMIDVMDRLAAANQKVRQKILDSIPATGLAPEQDDALRGLLEHINIRDSLKRESVIRDGQILDDFWVLPKAERTKEAHQALRTQRVELWDAYRVADAEYFGNEFLMRQDYAELLYKMPRQAPMAVDAEGRVLVPNDIARVLGCNVDEVSTAITEVVAFQDKVHFTKLISKITQRNKDAFKGFTDDKIHQVFDIIMDNMHLKPEVDVQTQKALMQIEGIKHEMITLKQTKSMSVAEETEVFNWIDNVANGMDELMYEPAKVIPTKRIKFPTMGTTTEKAKWQVTKSDLGELYIGSIKGKIDKELLDEVSTDLIAKLEWDTSDIAKSLRETASFKELKTAETTGDRMIAFDGVISEIHHIPGKEGHIVAGRYYEGGFDTIEALFAGEEAAIEGWIKRVPAKPPARALKPEFKDWQAVRQESWDTALKDYYKGFTDYTHENVIDFSMRHIFPYWTYEAQRWFFLPRTFIRRPGVLTAWGKYNEYSEFGYIPVPGTDIQLNPARGSIFGLTFGLTRRDYPYYYQQLGPAAEMFDGMMRYGFYPGAHIMMPITVLPTFTGRPPNLGEAMPAVYKTGLNILVGSPISGVSERAGWLTDHVFHENFRDYNIVTKIDKMQIDAGGKLIGGQTGQELWMERMEFPSDRRVWDITNEEWNLKEKRLATGLMSPEDAEAWGIRKLLATEKEATWNEAARYRAWLGLLMENIPIFRYRPDEQTDAFKVVTELIEAQTGLTAEQQEYLWKHNLRPTDVCPGIMDPALRRSMNQIWQYRIFLGRGVVLKPQKWSDLDMKTTRFWDNIEGYQKERTSEQARLDDAFLRPTTVAHLKGREWLDGRSDNWNSYMSRYETLKKSPEYGEVALTLDERADQLRNQGYPAPTASMFDEALRIYYTIKPEIMKDKYTGEEDIDWMTFYIKREAVIMALPPNLREEFESYIRVNETELERKHRDIVNTYFRGYWAVQKIILDQYTEEEKSMIAEYYADVTSLARKKEIEAFVSPTSGRQLISGYTSSRTDARIKLRTVSPKLDLYLYIFGYISAPRTDEAKSLIAAWEADRTSLLY